MPRQLLILLRQTAASLARNWRVLLTQAAGRNRSISNALQVIMGWSLGGAVALHAAALNPDAVRSLELVFMADQLTSPCLVQCRSML